ncbi:MAG: C10 family peptidase [Candidatus Cloacimonadales bacterium]
MNRFLLIVLISLFALTLVAKPMSSEEITTAVNNFVNAQPDEFTITENFSYAATRENSVNIYNLEPNGFVVLTDDDLLAPILAYSFTNQLDFSRSSENPFYQIFAEDMALRLQYYQKNPARAEANQENWQNLLQNEIRDYRPQQQWPAAGTTPTDGWVETRWNQTGVYNNMCPLDNSDERSVVGCVATAMAMIMDFHQYIGIPDFNNSDSFVSYGQGMVIDGDAEERDFPDFEELNGYLATVAQHYAEGVALTPTDLAALNFAAGISVEMMWSSDGSGAYTTDVAAALLNKFDYNTAQAIENNGTSFYNTLRQNMQNMQPAEIGIFTSGWQNGHAIIVDGYNTDDYYHLNFGWGTSNSTCWYLLPEGMPDNYSIISNAVVDIQGGALPVEVSGSISLDGSTPENTVITLEGRKTFQTVVSDNSGYYTISPVLSDEYSVTALKDNGAFYQYIDNVIIDENNTTLNLNLDNFSEFTGNITAPEQPESATVSFFMNGEKIGQTETDSNGAYSMPNIIPGAYQINANSGSSMFASATHQVEAGSQSLDLQLNEYSGELATSFASFGNSTWDLVPNYQLTCAVKIDSDLPHIDPNSILAQVKFKAPISADQGEIYPQLWKGNQLISQLTAEDFSAGEWLQFSFDTFLEIEADTDYFVGYQIISETGVYAWQDAEDRSPGYGAFTRTSGWNEVSSAHNFLIEPVIISNAYGVVEGEVVADNSATLDHQNTIIRAGNFATHPAADGSFQLFLTPGTYQVSANAAEGSAQISELEILAGQIIEIEDLLLDSTLDADDPAEIVLQPQLKANYPNPFYSNSSKRSNGTTISFSLDTTQNVSLEIYNIRGQKIKTLLDAKFGAGTHAIRWDGTDASQQNVASGIYFYKMQSGEFSKTRKMLLLK